MSINQKRVFWPGMTLIVLSLALTGLMSSRAKTAASAVTAVETAPETAPVPEPSPPPFKQRIRIWIHGDDVRPNLIHAWPGRARITVENETPVEVSLRVARVLPGGLEPFGTVTVPAEPRRLQRDVTLTEGEYVFFEVGHPTRRGRLIVEPRDGQ